MSDQKKYSINDVENGNYNYAKMDEDGNSHICNFSIPLKNNSRINGCVRMIQHEGEFFIKLIDVTEVV